MVNRRQITVEETEAFIKDLENKLKSTTGEQSLELTKDLEMSKRKLAGMRDGSIRIFQHIPEKRTKEKT